MRKIFALSLIALLVMGATAFGSSEIQSGDNAVILGPRMGPVGITPVTEVIKVYVTSHGTLEADQFDLTAAADQGVDVGDVMIWDTTRADGYCVAIATADAITAGIASAPFAGVMVTPCSRDTSTLTTPNGSGYNVGYMAVRGFCMAKVDSSASTTGELLVVNGGTVEGSFGTLPTIDAKSASQDIGTLLTDVGADSVMKVVLR